MRTTTVFSFKTLCQHTAVALLGAVVFAGVAFAEGEDGAQGVYSSHGGSPWATYYRYLEENPEIYAEADTTFPSGQTKYGQHGETKKDVPGPVIPGKIWPIVTQPSVPQGPEKMMNWAKTMDRITGYSQPQIGSANLSPAFAALSMGVAGQMLADQLQSPQATMPRAREEQNQQIQLSADNTAAMERQQAGCAIDFVASYLYNFTVEEGNKWNQVRNRLFLPMALLLLLPGAVLAQVKSIASQGFNVLGEISPFDGLIRSIIAIFLIPGTYLVVNYGIDVANSITKVVSEEYTKVFGTNMYEDAMCAHIRAFPFREPIENKNFVPNAEAKMGRLSPNDTPFAELEGKMINIKLVDPCAKLNLVPADRANEQVKYSVNAQRNAYNTANAALAMAWNILCAFQMAYLYYLWFVGPVVAALWVYPMKQLRDAFPSWCEGVITICFWSLFWSTVVLLMACFRGVDETGTVIMTAMNFLATACVKFAFDFAGLVKDAGAQAGKMAERMAAAGAGAGKPNGAHGANNAHGPNGANGHGPNGANGANGGAPNALPSGDDGTLSNAGPGGGFGFEGAEGGDGASGLQGGLSANNASGINGQVSMHGFPQPPLQGHHGNALGVVGTTLGSAALFAGIAALAQPHFMHGPGGATGLTGDPHGGAGNGNGTGAGGTHTGPGFAGAGSTSDASDGQGIPVASASMAGVGVDSTVVNEGDMYEHNWGESALNAPIASASLSADGPPLSSLPVSPSLSLTPDIAGSIGLPPSSTGGDAQSALTQGIIAGANGPDAIIANAGSGPAPNMVAHGAEPIGAVGVNRVGIPGAQGILGGHGTGVGHDAHHILGPGHAGHAGHAGHGGVGGVGGDQIAHNQQHAAHHHAGDQHHELNNLNAMFKDSVAMNSASAAAASAAAANAASASGAAGMMSATAASFSMTDLSQVSNQQQQSQYIDYSLAANNANSTTTANSTAVGGASTQYVDASSTSSANANYYDPSAASFSALAQSVAGDSVSYIDDGTVAYNDPGISTTNAAGDYSTTNSAGDYSTTYSGGSYGTDYVTTSYTGDYSSSYGGDYATTYGADYSTVVDDGNYIDNNSYASHSMPMNVSANVTSISDTSSGDSYTNALAAGGFVAPAPDTAPTQNVSQNGIPSVGSVNNSISSDSSTYSNVAVNTGDVISSVTPQPPTYAQGGVSSDIQINQQQPQQQQTQQQQAIQPNISRDIAMNAPIAGAAAAAAGSAFTGGNSEAQQQLRNKLAMPEGAQAKKAPVDQPKTVKVAPPGGKQIAGTGGKQSTLGAALGKAGTNSLSKPTAGPPVRPMPIVKPSSSVSSLQDSVTAANTRNRYVKSSGLTPEELAELEAKARESGTWLPTE